MRLFATIVALFAICAPAMAQRTAANGAVEEIQVLRSLRLSRTSPSDFCSERRVGFAAPTFEDTYDFKAVTARPADGVVTAADGPTAGHLRACFGSTADPLAVNFYADGDLGGVHFSGRGDCRTAGRDVPEVGITPWRCYLDLTGFSASFVGGQLTTNTVLSRAVLGAASDPVGYTQASIATIRLWRQR